MFHENIIKNDTDHKNYDTTMSQSYSAYFNSIGTKIHTMSKCGLIKVCFSTSLWCGLFYQGVFFLPAQFCKAVDLHWLYCTQFLSYNISWTTAPISIILQISIASSLYYTTVVIRRPEFWVPNFYSPFFSTGNVFMKT